MNEFVKISGVIIWLNSLTRSEFCKISVHQFSDLGINWEWVLWEFIKRYTKLMITPAALWMFIPCDKLGTPLRKPGAIMRKWAEKYAVKDAQIIVEAWKVAFQRCWFKGFVLQEVQIGDKKKYIMLNSGIHQYAFGSNLEVLTMKFLNGKTVKDLVNDGNKLPFTDQIFLKLGLNIT